MPQNGVEIMLRAQCIHDIVYNVIAAYAVGQPIHVEVAVAWEICFSMAELCPHEAGCNGALVVVEQGAEPWVRAADGRYEGAVAKGKMLDHLQNELWRDPW